MKFTLLILSLVALCAISAPLLEKQILEGKEAFTRESALSVYKGYIASGKDDAAFQIFFENFEFIYKHQQNPNRTFDMGVNRFAFMKFEDIKSRFLGAQNCSATKNQKNTKKDKRLSNFLPLAVDWRDNGVITPVKDQRQCGSCWTFSASGCLEAHWAIKTGVSATSLSEQNLVDCGGNFSNFGCNGGLPSQAFEYIRYNGGLSSENSYPYEAHNSSSCRFNASDVSALIPGGSVNITFQDEEELHQTVGTIGPVSVAFQVTQDFVYYKGGIYSNPNCSTAPEDVNHAVLVVGYGSEFLTDYWIIKNSWNEFWGENGYFRMVRGKNMCGVADCAAYPDVNGTSIEHDSFIPKKEMKIERSFLQN